MSSHSSIKDDPFSRATPPPPPDGSAPPELAAPPGSVQEPDDSLPEWGMDDLPPASRAAAALAGWTSLLPVQAKTIPYVMAKRDLMVQSRTGSGKTGAFLLPILERVDPSKPGCQALILTPTRELAHQVRNEAELLSRDSGIMTIPVYGGVGYGPQLDAFRAGVHIVVGTPGRILDHLIRRSLTLADLKIIVFDEADRLLSMGFYPDMRAIREFLPRRRYNAYLFSATYPSHVHRLAGEFLRDPDFLSLSRDHVHIAEVEHRYCLTDPMDKDRCLARLLEVENPPSAFIFCNTKSKVHYINVVLQRFGHDSDELSADLSQAAREKVLGRVRRGELRYLVATDVAARGIDIHELSHVFMLEPPEDPEGYIHRAGRTGRVGARGTVICLVSGMEEFALKSIAKRFGVPILPIPAPTAEDVEAVVAQRVTALLEADLRARDRVEGERLRRFLPLAAGLGGCEEEHPIVAMLLDEYYMKTLQAPVIPPQPDPQPGQQPAPWSPEPQRRRPPRSRGR